MSTLDLHMEALENIEAPEWSAGEVVGAALVAFAGGALVGGGIALVILT
jgi:hypothetical protein